MTPGYSNTLIGNYRGDFVLKKCIETFSSEETFSHSVIFWWDVKDEMLKWKFDLKININPLKINKIPMPNGDYNTSPS